MKNISPKKGCLSGEVHIHVDPTTIPLIQSKIYMKSEKYYVNNKLCKNPILDKYDMYEFIMTFLENEDLDDLLLLRRNYNMTLDALGTLTEDAKIRYLRTLICDTELHKFETICVHIRKITTTHLKQILLGLGTYCFPSNNFSNKKRLMRHGMRTPHKLKVRHYIAHMIELSEYLYIFPGTRTSYKI